MKPDPGHTTSPPSRKQRLLVAASIGIVAAIACFAFLARPGFGGDWFHVWAAARTLLRGGNPYRITPTGPMNEGADPLFYPLPAVLVVVPIAWLPLPASGAIFVGASSALLAYLLTRDGFARLPLFMSAPFLMATSLGQWSPLMAAAALEPNLGALAAAKPNLGLAAWAHRPSVRAIVGGVALVGLSFLVLPTWLGDWLHNISGRPEKRFPIASVWGPLLLLALLRWRRPEGRLFLTMAAVPQALFFYDQLLLLLIPRTFRQSLVLALCSHALFLAWRQSLEPGDFYVQEAVPFAAALYLPALVILLWPEPKRVGAPAADAGRAPPTTDPAAAGP